MVTRTGCSYRDSRWATVPLPTGHTRAMAPCSRGAKPLSVWPGPNKCEDVWSL